MRKILITDDCHPCLVDGLIKSGFIVNYLPGIPLDDIDKSLSDYDGIIINTRVKMDKKRITNGSRLLFIGRMGSGLDIIDVAFAREKKIAVISTPEGNAQAVGEHSLAMLLALLNKLPLGAEQVRQMKWDREAARGTQLSGKTIGIIGFGHTGPAFAGVLGGFKVDILVYDKYKDVKNCKQGRSRIIATPLNELLAKSDIMSLNLPLTEETNAMVDSEFISRMKDDVIIINASRGQVCSMPAIIENLKSGKILGCCFDVFPNEKTETYNPKERHQMEFLINHPNVLLTPHVAGWTFESKELISRLLSEKIIDFFRNELSSH